MVHDLEVVHAYCCGIDVHKRIMSACVLTPTGKEQKHFSTMTEDILELAAWLKSHQVPVAAMESTGPYWKSVYNILEEEGFQIVVVNPEHIKSFQRQKTDKKDAAWIASLLRLGLLKPSFIPSRRERDLRDLSRYRTSLVQERTRHIQRVQKILEGANIKIASLLSDVNGLSGRMMLQAIVEGRLTPEEMASLGRGGLKNTSQEYTKALTGRIRGTQQWLLAQQLSHIDRLTEEIAQLDAKLEEESKQIPTFEESLQLLDTIPGIGRQSAMSILIEIGLDMSRFPTAKHLAAWGGLAPGNHESAGKRKAEKSRQGNKYLKAVLVQAAHSLHRKKDCHLREQYQRIQVRRGGKRAMVAVAHSLLRIIYYILVRKEPYKELGAHYVTEKNKHFRLQRHIRELAKLGLVISQEMVDQQLAVSS